MIANIHIHSSHMPLAYHSYKHCLKNCVWPLQIFLINMSQLES